MTQFKNTPNLQSENKEGMVKRYVHQPLTNDHYGIHFTIQENGRILLRSEGKDDDKGEFVYDEVEIPASLVFKLATLLKATRTIKFVSVAEAATMPHVEEV
jgi:hypothetical protein